MAQQSEHKWSRNQRKYQEWLATPPDVREPRFQEDFAAKVAGVHRSTLSRWRQIDGFWDVVEELAQKFMIQDTAKVLATLRARAKRGDFQHLKLFLEMRRLHVDRSESDDTITIHVKRDHASSSRFTRRTENGHRRPEPVQRGIDGQKVGQNGAGSRAGS